MNLNNIFTRTLISSLAVGLIVFFISVPVAAIIISQGRLSELNAFVFLVALVMYVVYWPIQIALSLIHLILTRYWQRTAIPAPAGTWQAFFIAEWLLYMAIYLFLVWAFYEQDIWSVIFVFSIPYIISCNISVFTYKRNYESELYYPTANSDIR